MRDKWLYLRVVLLTLAFAMGLASALAGGAALTSEVSWLECGIQLLLATAVFPVLCTVSLLARRVFGAMGLGGESDLAQPWHGGHEPLWIRPSWRAPFLMARWGGFGLGQLKSGFRNAPPALDFGALVGGAWGAGAVVTGLAVGERPPWMSHVFVLVTAVGAWSSVRLNMLLHPEQHEAGKR